MKYILIIALLLGVSSVFAESEYRPAFYKASVKNSQDLQSSLQSDLKKLHLLFFAEKRKSDSLVILAEESSKRHRQDGQNKK